MDDEFDLFGDPVRMPSGKRGRPAHRPSQKNRNKVMVLLALGWSKERVANAIHVSVPTLKRYYFSELKHREMQRDRLDAWRFEKVIEQAETGNVGAQRLLDKMIRDNDMMLAAARLRHDDGGKDEKPMGKKESAKRAARDLVGDGNAGDWGDDLNPGYRH